MRRAKFLIVSVLLFLICLCASAQSDYEIENTSSGKVVVGLTQAQALDKFGNPDSVKGNVWYYGLDNPFYVYFENPVYLYPEKIVVALGSPIELKVLLNRFDEGVIDVTQDCEFIVSDTEALIIDAKNVIFPQRAGNYQIFAKHKKLITNICTVKVEATREVQKNIALQQIVIFPYNPQIVENQRVQFSAFGVFQNNDQKKVYIEDISSRASFMLKDKEKIINLKNRFVTFPTEGKYELFCSYRDTVSDPNEIIVYGDEESPGARDDLKQIIAFPEYVVVRPDYLLEFKAFASYMDNNFDDVTYRTDWFVKDKDIVSIIDKGKFLTKRPGITEIIATKNQKESLPLKIVVTRKDEVTMLPVSKKETSASLEELLQETRRDIEGFKEDISLEGRKLLAVKLSKDYLELGLGQEFEVKATAVYDDNKEEDVTFLGKWSSSQEKIASITKGRIKALKTGSTLVNCEYQNVRSSSLAVNVDKEKLISISLKPQVIELEMTETIPLTAEGFYSDDSKRDITALVDWHVENKGLVTVFGEGKLLPRASGNTTLFAQYLDVKSLSISISIRYGLKWIIWQIAKLIMVLIGLSLIIFIIMYISREAQKAKLLILMDRDPRQFVIKLYENISRLLQLVGSRPLKGDAYLAFAVQVQNKYQIKDNCFLSIVEIFEKAKFSSYDISKERAETVLNAYNLFLFSLLARLNKLEKAILNAKAVYFRTILQLRK
ncbi:MAG: hypothetical protein P9L96_00530 [Candidatus Gygaella obscura]|nr:hypothetical protein [Candidatus Gygaella obscura]